jgi:hypothetical protein
VVDLLGVGEDEEQNGGEVCHRFASSSFCGQSGPDEIRSSRPTIRKFISTDEPP